MSSIEDKIDGDVSISEFEAVVVSVVWMTSGMTSGVVLISFSVLTTLVNVVSSPMAFCVVVSPPMLPLHTFLENVHVVHEYAATSTRLISVNVH